MPTATLVWAPSHSPNLAGFKVYYGQTSGGPYNGLGSPKVVGNVIETTIELPNGGRWYFALAEYYTVGPDSALSAETFADYFIPTTSIAVNTSGIFRLRHR